MRNVLENPGWYTPYTPYQAEIAQGRLEALLTFQTMVSDLTGMEIANASLLDEATAAAEAMAMLHRVQARRIEGMTGPAQFFVADSCFPQTIDLLTTRAEPLGIELIVGDFRTAAFGDRVFGALVQTPDEAGRVHDLRDFIATAKAAGVAVAVGTDLLSLVLLTPPGEMGADVAFGNSQRFGVPLGYGGPHAAFFATPARAHPAGPRPHRRRLGGCARSPGVPHGAADPRAAHPPRKGDVEHLHRAGAARQHRRPCTPSITAPGV